MLLRMLASLHIAFVLCLKTSFAVSFEQLTPYIGQHGSRLDYSSLHECQKQQHGTTVHEVFPSHRSSNASAPLYEVKRFVKEMSSVQGSRLIRGHYATVLDPMRTLSVLEPNQVGGCKLNIRQTVAETSKQKNCVLAVNAGYFDTKSGKCHGNVVSNGKIAQDSGGIQNAHFGLKNDGNIFTGYVSEDELLGDSSGFLQLVGGVVWILRNGSDYVNTSSYLECESTEETGSMKYFVEIPSARTAIGHDNMGRVIIVHVEGKSGIDGISLLEFQKLLKEFGVVNAINLDGGGSSTLVINGSVVNYPYDMCEGDAEFACSRKVSTVVCVHPPECQPADCSGHGRCIAGQCMCDRSWLPPACETLMCGNTNCSGNGVCSTSGCVCQAGYHGIDCENRCPEGWFGFNCAERCLCSGSATCDPINGHCKCRAGFMGSRCEKTCPLGTYGQDCLSKCTCEESCFCDPVNGSCTVPLDHDYYVGCLAKNITSHEEQRMYVEKRKWQWAMAVVSVICALSIASTVLLVFYSCSCHCKVKQCGCLQKKKARYRDLAMLASGLNLSDSSDSEGIPIKDMEKR